MSETRNFYAPNLNSDSLVQALKDWYRAQAFNAHMLDLHAGGVLIQFRQEQAWRNVVGMSFALKVVLRQNAPELIVEIEASKWIDKALVGIVSILFLRVLWPLALTAGYGAWKQSRLPKRTFEFIQQFVSTGESTLPPTLPGWQSGNDEGDNGGVFCSNCGKSAPENTRFCSNCGHNLF